MQLVSRLIHHKRRTLRAISGSQGGVVEAFALLGCYAV
jgi:hypothetical protein